MYTKMLSKRYIIATSSMIAAVVLTVAIYTAVQMKYRKDIATAISTSALGAGGVCTAPTTETTENKVYFVGCGGFF